MNENAIGQPLPFVFITELISDKVPRSGRPVPFPLKHKKINFRKWHFYLTVLGIISQPGNCDKKVLSVPREVFLTLQVKIFQMEGKQALLMLGKLR